MTGNERNKRTLVIVVVLLLLCVLVFAGCSLSLSSDKSANIDLKINQLYSSDYELSWIDNNFFIGSYESNRIDVIIDGSGNEIYKGELNIYYDGIYKLKDERYLIYDNNEGNLTTYIFDGKNISTYS